MGLNQHPDQIDERIRTQVSMVREEALDLEYRIVEDLCRTMNGTTTLLEVGCGSLGLLGRKGQRLSGLQRHSIGIDFDVGGLAENANVRHRVCADSYSLPLRSGSVDIIVSRWMFEHLAAPDRVLREFARVLRPGGFLYIKTPNLWNYAMMVSRATPTAVHNLFRSTAGHGENIPTFYRANTRRQLERLAKDTGFEIRRFHLHSYSYTYYMFNRELFLLMRAVSRIAGRLSDKVQLMLCCVLQKV